MRYAFCFLAFACGLSTTAADAPTSVERLTAIRKRVDEAQKEYFKTSDSLGDTKEDQDKEAQLRKAFDTLQEAGFVAALELAKADPKSEPGFEALEWLLTTLRAYYKPVGKPAIELMAEHYAADARVAHAVAVLGAVPPPATEPTHSAAMNLIAAVAAKNPDRTARGQAYLALALQAKKEFEVAEYRGLPTEDALAAAAERRYETLERDYGDCPHATTKSARAKAVTLGETAKANLHELRNLRAGKTAPDVAGEDLAGAKFKLSDSRGRVTLLVFWASWCGPCMAAVPHENAIAARFKGRPFALVGVNGDHDQAAARKAVEKAQITWQSFRNPDPESEGPIPAAYNVRSWPTVYVIDHKGVIRARSISGRELDETLEELIAEAEAAKAGK